MAGVETVARSELSSLARPHKNVFVRGDPRFDKETLNRNVLVEIAEADHLQRRGRFMEKKINEVTEAVQATINVFSHAMDRLVDTEKQLEEKTKKVSGTVRDSAQKLADGLNRVEKLANFERLERYVGLLERAAVAEFERSLLLERQAEGIALAKQEGKYKGRKPVLNADQAADLCCRVAAGESKAAVGRAMGIGRSSVYAYLAAGSPLTS